MAQAGAIDLKVTATGKKVVIVAAMWHEQAMDGLIAGAIRACEEAGADYQVVRAPGSFELPVVAKAYAQNPENTAIVALGVVVRGGTPHFDYVCDAATYGLTKVSVETGKPVGFGVLTCDNSEQALARAGLPGSSEDKGYEATMAALHTAQLIAQAEK